MDVQHVPAMPAFAERFGYSQAKRIGPCIALSGTPPRDAEGRVVGQGDVYAQALQVLENVRDSLRRLGAGPEHVLRSRVYLTDMAHVWDIGRAHLAFYGDSLPTVALVKVPQFFDPDILVEMDADAWLPD